MYMCTSWECGTCVYKQLPYYLHMRVCIIDSYSIIPVAMTMKVDGF